MLAVFEFPSPSCTGTVEFKKLAKNIPCISGDNDAEELKVKVRSEAVSTADKIRLISFVIGASFQIYEMRKIYISTNNSIPSREHKVNNFS